MRNASTKSITVSIYLQFNLHFQTNDVIINPENPVNPDSKRQITGIIWKLTFHILKNLLFPVYPDSKSLLLYTPPISFTPTFADIISGTEGDLPLSTI